MSESCRTTSSLRKNAAVVERDEFERIRSDICASGPASDGDDLLGMEIDCCAYFGDPSVADDSPGLWHDMKVSRSEGAEWLISGQALGRQEDAVAIASTLCTIWDQDLRYQYRSAYTVDRSESAVTLRAVTQIGPGALWVTAHIQVAIS